MCGCLTVISLLLTGLGRTVSGPVPVMCLITTVITSAMIIYVTVSVSGTSSDGSTDRGQRYHQISCVESATRLPRLPYVQDVFSGLDRSFSLHLTQVQPSSAVKSKLDSTAAKAATPGQKRISDRVRVIYCHGTVNKTFKTSLNMPC